MAIGEDRVQLTKVESTALGGNDSDIDPFGAPSPIEPQEDAIESCGLYIQDNSNRDENVGIYRDGNNLCLFDNNGASNQYPGYTLTQLITSSAVGVMKFIPVGTTVNVLENYQYIVHHNITIEGELILDGELVIIE
ncbi:MAG: hypothetical protein BV456_03115 [Thermoplasmata archaeon M8B2D]|nr:MAG: hypothetical protein BV456_03115 [Thermoplasmata archaeon M8B2D]